MDKATVAAETAARMQDAEEVLRENNYDKARLVPILQGIQARYRWLSKDLISYVAKAVGLPPAREICGQLDKIRRTIFYR